MKRSRIIPSILLFACCALVVIGFSKMLTYFNTGAQDKIFNLDSELFRKSDAEITWLEDDSNIPGKLHPHLRLTIENAYGKARQILNLSNQQKRDLGLKDHFTKPMISKIKSAWNDNQITPTINTINHNLKLHFVSFDKTVISFSDLNTIDSISINDQHHKQTKSYGITMLLEDGYWRIDKMHSIPIIK